MPIIHIYSRHLKNSVDYFRKKLNLAFERGEQKRVIENFQLTNKQLATLRTKQYGVKFSPVGVKKLLHRLGFVYKKPKHVPGKLDPEAQAAFVEMYAELRENKGENDPIYFVDACHAQQNSIPVYGWIRRGVEKHLKSTGSWRRVSIHGAIDIDTLQTVTDFPKTINAYSSLRLLKKLAAKHPDAEAIHIILDNATYYTSAWLRDQLAALPAQAMP